jgi:Flp pilus assembly protein TadG
MRCRSGADRRAERRADRGAVTAEIAVALPSLVLVLGLGLGALEAAATQIACVDAARQGARSLARGDPPEEARRIAVAGAPQEAAIEMEIDSGQARVTVVAQTRLGAPFGPRVTVECRAATPREPGT